jgi:hypothetical protein
MPRPEERKSGSRCVGRASLHSPAGLVAVRSRVCCGSGGLDGRGRCRGWVGLLRCRVGACSACRGSGAHSWPVAHSWSSALGSAQPSSNYAFKRTAGTLHRVSCCSVGPRPLNAPLDEGAAFSRRPVVRGHQVQRRVLCPGFAEQLHIETPALTHRLKSKGVASV